jgi:hypothetical protein
MVEHNNPENQPIEALSSSKPAVPGEKVIQPTQDVLEHVRLENSKLPDAIITPTSSPTPAEQINTPTINLQDYKGSEAYIKADTDRLVAKRAPILYLYSIVNIALTASTFFTFSSTKQKLINHTTANQTAVNEGQTLAVIILLIVIAITAYLIFTKKARIVKRILMIFAIIEALGVVTSLGNGKLLSIVSSIAQFALTVVTFIYVSKLRQI